MAMTEKNPGALNRLRMRCRALGSPEFRGNLHQVLAGEALKQLADEFVESRDPYGREWEPITSRDGQPLRNRGHMASSAHVNPKADGFSITLDQGHPKTHQYGATIHPVSAAALRFFVRGKAVFAKVVTIPQRILFPSAQRGLGVWGRPLKAEAARYMHKVLGGQS